MDSFGVTNLLEVLSLVPIGLQWDLTVWFIVGAPWGAGLKTMPCLSRGRVPTTALKPSLLSKSGLVAGLLLQPEA